MVHINDGILLRHKKRFVTMCVDLENILLNKISQTDKAKSHMISLIYVGYKTEIHRQTEEELGY